MSSNGLKKLLRRSSGLRKILTGLSKSASGPLAVEDADGRVIFGAGAARPAQRYPIIVDDAVVGWAAGDASAAVAADLLQYAAGQEDEKKSLANELLERYRELSLLYHLSERMAASPQPASVAEIALDEARRLIKADSGAVLLQDKDGLCAITAYGDYNSGDNQLFPFEQILRNGKAELINDLPDGQQQASILAAPLITERRALGIMVLVGSRRQVFTAGELKLLGSIASQVAPALEVSRLYQESIEKTRFEHELKMAREVQESLLPARMPEIPGWAAASRWRPARVVSGDFYDVIATSQHSADLFIADVTDKGMPAALIMAVTRSILSVSIHSGGEPAGIIARVNSSISRDGYEGLFTTLVFARLDLNTGQVTFVNAGHNPPLLYHARDGEIETLRRTGLPLGVDTAAAYAQETVRMDVGDFILFYTDGITEAPNPDQKEFGIERLKQLVLHHRDCEVEDLLDKIEAALQQHTGPGQPADDMTIVGLKRIRAADG